MGIRHKFAFKKEITMLSTSKQKKWLQIPIGEFLIWLIPLILALIAHTWASGKAYLNSTGPGFFIAFMDNRTIYLQRLWHIVEQNYWLFTLYGLLLIVLFATLQIKQAKIWIKATTFCLFAIPGVWYFENMSYLGGKLLMFH